MKRIDPKIQVTIGILVLLLIMDSGYLGLRSLSTQSYVSGYQGAKARFVGVQYGGKNYAEGLWDTTMRFDPDATGSGKPSIAGEMTSVFIPSESLGKQQRQLGGRDISDWLVDDANVRNPVNEYEWELKTGDNMTDFYRMEEWQLKWYFSLSCEPTGSEVNTNPVPVTNDQWSNRLSDVKVWFEIDLAPIWYFENSTSVYFAVAEMRLSSIALGGKLGKAGESASYKEERNSNLRVTPMSPQSVLSIYYGKFGSESNRAETTAYQYKGKQLNPDLFTSKVYTYFTLNDFGVNTWFDYGVWYRADSITVGVDVNVFVVGEWLVKDVQDIPDDYGRDAKTGGDSWLGFLNKPEGRLLFVLALAIIGFILLLIFVPNVMVLLMLIFGNRRRR